MENKSKVLVALGVAAVALTGTLVHDITESPVVEYQNVTEFVNVTVTETVEVVREVPVNVTVIETIEFEDEAFKALACDRLQYDDIKECVEEVEAEAIALELAVAEIKAEFAEFLDDEDVVKKDSDVRIIEIYSDFEDVVVVKSNFDNDRYVFEIKVKYEDEREDSKDKVVVKIEVEDSEVKILSIR